MSDSVSDSTQRFLDAWEPFASQAQLQELRRGALDRFAKHGLPTTRVEEWKYTNLRRLERHEFALIENAPTTLPDKSTLPLADADLPTIAFVNGRFVPDLSSLDKLPESVKFNSIATLLEKKPDVLREHIEAELADNDGRPNSLAALNTAFFADGVVIEIAPDAQIERPVHLLFISQHDENSVVSHPKILIDAGRGSDASIIEQHIGIDDAVSFTNSVARIVLRDNAVLRHYRVQQENEKSFLVDNTRVRHLRDSRYVSLNIDLGGMLVRHDLHAHMDGENSETTLDGLFILGGTQHCDNHTYIHHDIPQTRSRERYKGVLGGRSKGVYNGMVYVKRGAQKTDSEQVSHNLLLSQKAEIDTKPELEIYADDVKCNHGATIGQLDETALFYLQSRGIEKHEARRLLTMAFAREMLDSVKDDAVREYLEKTVLDNLGQFQE